MSLFLFEVDMDAKKKDVWRWKRIAERFQGTNCAVLPNPVISGRPQTYE
jgi:hypothetical protein